MQSIFALRSSVVAKRLYGAKHGLVFGIAAAAKARLLKHNEGANEHTKKFKPWKLVWFCAFPDKTKAAAFEKYLKSSSGIAFRRKRLM